MSVWVCVPSKRPPAEVAKWAQAWRDMGYRIALWRDYSTGLGSTEYQESVGLCDALFLSKGYPGYAQATNRLIANVFFDKLDGEGNCMISGYNPSAHWCVIGGDDIYPDTTKRAAEIAAECQAHFALQLPSEVNCDAAAYNATFGVMQPTGDRWADGEWGFSNAPIDRVAGSAWIGREFALRAYGGKGPLWPEYVHMFVDEELQRVAEKLGVFWQRRDLTQLHNHWARGNDKTRAKDMPAFLAEANSPEHWAKYKALFEARAAAGFPGHEVK